LAQDDKSHETPAGKPAVSAAGQERFWPLKEVWRSTWHVNYAIKQFLSYKSLKINFCLMELSIIKYLNKK
jgi:hypothetical protein